MCARLRVTIEFTDHEVPVIITFDHSRRDAVEADETKTAEDPLSTEVCSQELFVSQPILQG